DGSMRHPIFLGLREDVPPESVKREVPERAPATLAPATRGGDKEAAANQRAAGAGVSAAVIGKQDRGPLPAAISPTLPKVNEPTLLYVANLGCIELNPWNSRLGSVDNPDYLIIDLDPAGVPFSQVVEAAQKVRRLLEKGCGESYCKTSGKRGLHVYVPLGAR